MEVYECECEWKCMSVSVSGSVYACESRVDTKTQTGSCLWAEVMVVSFSCRLQKGVLVHAAQVCFEQVVEPV